MVKVAGNRGKKNYHPWKWEQVNEQLYNYINV